MLEITKKSFKTHLQADYFSVERAGLRYLEFSILLKLILNRNKQA